MRSDYLPEELKRLWKELESNPIQVSPDHLRREARKLRGGVRLRNGFVVGVCGFIMAAYAFFFFHSNTALERIGSALSIAGTANAIVLFLMRPGRTLPDGATDCLRFYRGELERQRDFHLGKGVLSWLLPVLPGPILFNVAFALDRPMFAPLVELQMVGFLMVAAIVVPLNLRLARKYGRRLGALEASHRQ